MQEVFSSKQLTGYDLIRFQEEFEEKKRYALTAWLLFIFLGGFGAHRFYLKDNNGGLVRIILVLLTFLVFPSISYSMLYYNQNSAWIEKLLPILFIAPPINSILWFIDLFRLPKLIYESNKKIEREILSRIVYNKI